VPALLRVIETEDSALARWYGFIYSKIPVNFRKPLPVPRDPDRIIATAFAALDQFGAQASPAVPSLIDLYQLHPRRTISALNAIGSSASNAVPTLIPGLHPTNLYCFQTASALWRIDPSGDLTAAALSQLAARGELRTALRNFEAQPLSSVVQPPGTTSAWGVCEVLGCLRPEAERVVPALAALLRDENERVRARAAEALGRFGPVASDAAQEIRRLTEDRWRMVREAATNSLKAIESQR